MQNLLPLTTTETNQIQACLGNSRASSWICDGRKINVDYETKNIVPTRTILNCCFQFYHLYERLPHLNSMAKQTLPLLRTVVEPLISFFIVFYRIAKERR